MKKPETPDTLRMIPVAALALVFLLLPPLLPGQTLAEEEASPSIFETRLGDADVELFLDGYWDASVRSSIGLAFLPGYGLSYPFVFPGFSDGLVFEQKPDLLISLWLKERFYLETTIGEDYEMNSYLLGYQGKEGELVQSVKGGNRDIEISPYPYMDFPGSARKSPGISAVFQTARSQHEFLLRYDPSLPQKKTFIGKNEVQELRIDPSSYVKGRHFVLPDRGGQGLELFIEDRDGTVVDESGRRYRRASNYDYSYSPGEGLLSLTQASPGRVLVYYEKDGLSVGDSGLGSGALPAYTEGPPITIDEGGTVNFSWGISYMGQADVADWLQVQVAGRQALLLYDPGAFNPFEIHGVYSLSGFSPSPGSSPRLVRRGSSAGYSPRSPLSLAFSAEGTEVRVLGEGDANRSMASRFPFAGDEPRLYGPDRLSDGGGTDFEILIQSYTPVEGYRLTNDLIPGSVTVLRNGRREDSFSIDYSSGVLRFPFEPAASDRIEIFYRTYSGEGEGGDILFGSGSTIDLGKDFLLKIATGIRWNVLKGSYSTAAGDHTGYLGASAQLAYQGERLQATADGALLYMNPDTSGLLRLMGMEKHEMELEMSKYNMFPSSIPAPGSPYADGMTAENRGKLYFKNYEKTDLLGSVSLSSYTASPTDSFPYESGSFPGPYIASAASEGFDEVMVLDYDLDSNEEWVGAQLNLSTGWAGSLDLSRITSIRFAYKEVDLQGDVDLRFHIGALDEDLDGDGILDEETAPSSRGYPFNHGNMVLYVGAGQKGLGNEYRDSEDANGNKVLDRENPDLVFAGEVETIPGTGSWQTGLVHIPLSERNKLAATRSLRLLVRKSGSGSRTGRILVGKMVFEGASAAARADEGGSLSLREVPEVLKDVIPADDKRTLAQAHRDILSTFHSRDSTQHVLEADWEKIPAGKAWEIRSFTTPVPAGDYETLNLFLRVTELDSADPAGPVSQGQVLLLSYTDSQGRGLRDLEIPLTEENADNIWSHLQVDLSRGRASLAGRELTPATVDRDHGELSRFSLRLENQGNGAPAGVLYLDEVYLSDPRDGLGFAGSLDFSYSAPGTVLSLAGVPLVSNLEVSQVLNARSSQFHTQKDADTEPGLLTSATRMEAEVLNSLRLRGEFALAQMEDHLQVEGGHELHFPAQGGPLILTDKYKRHFNSPSPAMSRENRLRLAPSQGVFMEAGSETVLSSGTLSQTWEGSAGFDAPAGFSLKMRGDLEHSAQGYSLDDRNYGESWLSAYRLLAPWKEGTGDLRQGTYRLDSGYTGEKKGIIATVDLAYYNSAQRDGQQKNAAGFDLEVPLVFQKGPGHRRNRLSLLYSRRSNMVREVPMEGNFDSDLRAYTEALTDHRYLWNSIPFAEIIGPSKNSSFAGDSGGDIQGEYSSKAVLRFSRPFSSRILDLLVPSQAEGEAGKTLTRGGDVLGASNNWNLSLTNFAINLFGRQGAYPRFSRYDMDEFQIQNSLSLRTREGDPEWELAVTSHQILSLLGRDRNRFVLDHSITVEDRDTRSYRGTGSLRYVRRSPMLRDFDIAPLRKAMEEGAHYLHTETLDLNYNNVQGFQTYLVLGHETALSFRGNSFIKAEINLGLGFEKDYSGLPPGYRLLFGLGGGISAHLLF